MLDGVESDILLVEDNSNDAELTTRALKKLKSGPRIARVVDGAEALDFLFRSGPYQGAKGDYPKVVFLDLKLPKLDGFDVLQRLRSDERTKSIPVVMLTSSKADKDAVESYRLGVNSYVVKPMDFQEFSAAVAELGTYWLSLNHVPKWT